MAPAVAAAQGDDLLGVDLEQARRRNRADREGPFGSLEAQPRARAAGDQDDADLARGQRIGPDSAGAPPDHPLAVGLRQPDDLDRLDPVRVPAAADRDRSAPTRRSSRSSCSKSIARDLGRQTRLACLIQLPPPSQRWLCPCCFKRSNKTGSGDIACQTPETKQTAVGIPRESLDRIQFKIPLAVRRKPGPPAAAGRLRRAMIEAVR